MSAALDTGRWSHGRRAAAMLALLSAATPLPTPAAMVTWQSWAFDHEVSGNFDGLSLKNVTYQGRTIIGKMSMPVVRVFYDNNACGPYADRLGGTLSQIPWADNATLAQREFTLNGRQWYEIGIRDRIGSYDLYQAYYLSADGIIDAHLYSKGLQCVVNHIHYPNWRIDLDLDGAGGDQILRDTGTGLQVLANEFNANAASAVDHAWRVRDVVTGLYVDVLPGFTDFSIPTSDTTVPIEGYDSNTVFGRLYRTSEDVGWTYGPNTQVPYNNAENIDNVDIVFWYEAYLPHGASEGSALWHSTGVRLVTSLGTPPPDADGDGIADADDNCVNVANADQRDTNGDGYGNLCDADLDDSGGPVNAADLALFRAVFGTVNADADLNGSGGVVNAADLAIFRSLFGQPPGP